MRESPQYIRGVHSQTPPCPSIPARRGIGFTRDLNNISRKSTPIGRRMTKSSLFHTEKWLSNKPSQRTSRERQWLCRHACGGVYLHTALNHFVAARLCHAPTSSPQAIRQRPTDCTYPPPCWDPSCTLYPPLGACPHSNVIITACPQLCTALKPH